MKKIIVDFAQIIGLRGWLSVNHVIGYGDKELPVAVFVNGSVVRQGFRA